MNTVIIMGAVGEKYIGVLENGETYLSVEIFSIQPKYGRRHNSILHNCIAYGETAINLNKNFVSGEHILISGHIDYQETPNIKRDCIIYINTFENPCGKMDGSFRGLK